MPDKHDYEVAWICLADVEFAAAQTFLSNPDLPQRNSIDDIEYVPGLVGSLHVVVVKSTSSSTFGFSETVALVTHFPDIKKCLLISSGGGAPTRKHDIRLGDVVVSRSNDGSGAIQYDYHKAMQEGILEETAHLDTPESTAFETSDFPGGLPQTLESLCINGTTIYHDASIDQLDWMDSFKRPLPQADLLHKSGTSLLLKHWVPMFDDDASKLVKRVPRASFPTIHYGKIASAVLPMVNGIARNFYASTESILCFETGASKIYHGLPALLICGICDYADGYTDGAWRICAAMAASACASEFTRLLDIQKIRAEVNIGEVLTQLIEKPQSTGSTSDPKSIWGPATSVFLLMHHIGKSGLARQAQKYFQKTHLNRYKSEANHSLMELLDLQSWLDKPGRTLLCPSLPQAEKLSTMAAVIDHVHELRHDSESVGLAFIYFSPELSQAISVEALLMVIIDQLLDCLDEIPDSALWLCKPTGQGKPTLRRLSETLASITKTFSRVFLFLGGLEDCPDTLPKNVLFKQLSELQWRFGCNLLVTFNLTEDMVTTFSHDTSLKSNFAENDLWEMLESRISRDLPAFICNNTELRSDIISTILLFARGDVNTANGLLKDFHDSSTESDVRTSLAAIFNTLNVNGTIDDLQNIKTRRQEALKRLEKLGTQTMSLSSSVSDDKRSLHSVEPPSIFSSRRSSFSISGTSVATSTEQLVETRYDQATLLLKPQDSSLEGTEDTDESTTHREERSQLEIDDADIESVFSDTESIHSQVSSSINRLEFNALHLLVDCLASDKQLAPLFRIALAKMKKERFSNNLRRILKFFYLQLRLEASNEREKMVVRVLRSRSMRTRLAHGIVKAIRSQPADDTFQQPALDSALLETRAYKRTMNEWLARLPPGRHLPQDENTPLLRGEVHHDDRHHAQGAAHAGASPAVGNEHDSDSDNNSEGELTSDDDETSSFLDDESNFPQIRYVELFLTRSRAFRAFCLDMRFLTLPGAIREIIDSVPKASIRVTSENDVSFLNKTKLFLEIYTGCQWDWAPLSSPLPNIQTGNRRIEWKIYRCELQREVTEEVGTLLEDILPFLDDHPPKCQCCLIRPPPPSLWTLVRHAAGALSRRLTDMRCFFRRAIGGSWESEQEPLSSASIWAGTENTVHSSDPIVSGPRTTMQRAARGHVGSPPNTENNTGNASASPNTHTLHVIFGVQGWNWTLALDGISVLEAPSDSKFFQSLRKFHRSNRVRLIHWFSAFKFLNCRFVKFEKTFIKGITSGSRHELPDECGHSGSYTYQPRGPNAKPPLIDPKLFRILLSECDDVCIWRFIIPWHNCIRLTPDISHLGKIPKKTDGFSMLDEAGETIAFGIEADYMVSFKRLAIYHLFLLIAPVVFWAWWLTNHPGDWQNASVPLVAVVALITVFWFMFDRRIPIS